MTFGQSGDRQRGFSMFELGVSAAVFAVLATVFLIRTQQYHGEVERQAVERTVGVLRAALQLRSQRGGKELPSAELARLAEQNPLDLLPQKPANYLGEYYSPPLETMPMGNWVFDRRDKTLIYLLSSHRSFRFDTSKFLKFKVEFAQARLSGRNNGPIEVPNGLVIVQLSDQAAIDSD